MLPRHIEILDRFLADPFRPVWSSFAMENLFAAIEGEAKQKFMTVLRLADDRLNASRSELTLDQSEFIRSVTLYASLTDCASDIPLEECEWLLTSFKSNKSPQRALMIALLLHPDELSPEIWKKVVQLLIGTSGERFIDSETY